jgi:hypothetical protein
MTPVPYAVFWYFFNDLPDSMRSLDLLGVITQAVEAKVRFWAFLVSFIPMSIDAAASITLIKLFTLYEKGIIFAVDNVKYFRRLGYLLVLWSFASVLYEVLITNIFSVTHPPAQIAIVLNLQIMNFSTLITGIIIIVISWVIDEGRELEDEKALTI